MAYVDGFLLPVPTKNLETYIAGLREKLGKSGESTARSGTASASETTSR